MGLCATLVKPFCLVCILSLFLLAQLPRGVRQKSDVLLLCSRGPDFESYFLAASVKQRAEAAGEKTGKYYPDVCCSTLCCKPLLSVVPSYALTWRMAFSTSCIHCIYLLYCCFWYKQTIIRNQSNKRLVLGGGRSCGRLAPMGRWREKILNLLL